MTLTRTFLDAEDAVMEWATAPATGIAALVGSSGTRKFIFNAALPDGSPMPAVVISRTGGAPRLASDVPIDEPRITFNCWGTSLAGAKALAAAVTSAAESLDTGPAFVCSNGVRLLSGSVVLVLFRPDANSEKPAPRYVVDVKFAIIAAQ